jgi:retron-type reverse transcriptase
MTIFTLSNLLAAYYSCRKKKRKTINAIKFELDLETNLLQLKYSLETRTYQPKKSICFVVTYPKIREIFAADFADRIIHHLLVAQIEPYYEKIFIDNSFACRKGKGTHKALKNLHQDLKWGFYAQFDIQSFFTSIDKKILYEIIRQKIVRLKRNPIWKEEILYLTQTIIFHDPTKNYRINGDKTLWEKLPQQKSLFGVLVNKGLPIGNLTSQFFANVYLNELDQFVKRKVKVKYYFRYVDDLVLLSDNLDELKKWRVKIGKFLQNKLRLQLHPDKDKYGLVSEGIDFIGYIIRPNYILSRKRVVDNLKAKLHYFNQVKIPPSKEEIKQMIARVNSYYGHFRHANCYNLRKNLYEKHFGILKTYLKPVDDYHSFKIK